MRADEAWFELDRFLEKHDAFVEALLLEADRAEHRVGGRAVSRDQRAPAAPADPPRPAGPAGPDGRPLKGLGASAREVAVVPGRSREISRCPAIERICASATYSPYISFQARAAIPPRAGAASQPVLEVEPEGELNRPGWLHCVLTVPNCRRAPVRVRIAEQRPVEDVPEHRLEPDLLLVALQRNTLKMFMSSL